MDLSRFKLPKVRRGENKLCIYIYFFNCSQLINNILKLRLILMNHDLFLYALLAHCAFGKASMKFQISNNFREDPEGPSLPNKSKPNSKSIDGGPILAILAYNGKAWRTMQAALEYTNISWSLPLNYPTMLNPSYMLLALPAYCRPSLGTLPHPRLAHFRRSAVARNFPELTRPVKRKKTGESDR